MATTAELIVKAVDQASSIFKAIGLAASGLDKTMSGIKLKPFESALDGVAKAADKLAKNVKGFDMKALELALDGAAKKTSDFNKTLDTLSKEAGPALKKAEDAADNLEKAIDKAGKTAGTTMAEGFAEAGKKYGELRDRISEGLAGFGEVGEKLKGVGEAAFGFFEKAIEEYSKFEGALQKTMTMTQLQGHEYEAMGEKVGALAERIAVDFGVKATDVLKAFYFALSVGVKPGTEAMENLSVAAIKIGKVYGTDVVAAMKEVVMINKIFSSSMETSGHTANVLFRASQMGMTTIPQLAAAMNEGGKAAAAMGIPMEDAAAILVQLSDRGNAAGQAGQLFRNVLLRLAAPPKDAAAALKELGVNVYDGTKKMMSAEDVVDHFGKAYKKLSTEKKIEIIKELGIDAFDASGKLEKNKIVLEKLSKAYAEGVPPEAIKTMEKYHIEVTTGAGKMRPIIDILTDLKKATSTLSDEELNRTMKSLAGQRAFAAFSMLLKGNVGDLKDYKKELVNATGLDKAWEDAKKTLIVQTDRLKESVNQLMERIGKPLVEALTPIVEKMVEVAKSVGEWMEKNKELVKNIAIWSAVAAAIALAVGTIMVIMSGLGAAILAVIAAIGSIAMAGPAFAGLAAAIAPALPIIAAVMAGIMVAIGIVVAAVVALALAWKNNFLGIRDRAMEVWNGLKSLFATIVTTLQQTFTTIWNIIGPTVMKIWNDLVKYAQDFWMKLQPILSNFVTEATKIATDLFKWISDEVTKFQKDFGPQLESMWKAVTELLDKVWKFVEPWIPKVMDFILLTIGGVLTTVINTIKGWVFLFEVAMKLIEPVIKIVAGAFELIIKAVSWMVDRVRADINTMKVIFDTMKVAVMAPLNALAMLIDAWTGGALTSLIKKLKDLQAIIALIKGAQNTINTSKPTTTQSGGSGSSGADAESPTGKTIIIHGNVIASSSSMRSLEDDLSKYTAQRLSRGMA